MSSTVERSVRSWKSTWIHSNIVLKENRKEHSKYQLEATTSRYYQVPLALAVVPTLRLKIQWALINKTFISLNSHCTNIVLLISPTSFVNFAKKYQKIFLDWFCRHRRFNGPEDQRVAIVPLWPLCIIYSVYLYTIYTVYWKNHLKDIRIHGYKDLRYCAPLTALYIYTHYTHCITQYIEKP